MRAAVVCAAMAVVASPVAFAGPHEPTHPRTPVDWPPETPCMTVVDKATAPVWHLDYRVPFEDVDVTPDEVADSRTLQFFAFCRDRQAQRFLPNWISVADVEAAIAMNLVEGASISMHDILDTATAWSGCFDRITDNDERRPITFAAAEQGVDWDLTAVPEGTYVIYGYTHEPAFNLWRERPGVVKVIDAEVSIDVGPGGAITTPELILIVGETGTIEGCVNAATGSTLAASYASTRDAAVPDWAPTWVPFVENEPIDSDQFSVTLDAPADEAGNSLMVRVDFVDPDGAEYTAFMRDLVIVLSEPEPEPIPEPNPNPPPSTGTAAEEVDELDGNCTCTNQARNGPSWLLGLLVLAARRKRR